MVLKIALAQMDIAWEDKEKNKRRCEAYVRRASAQGADVIVFPEMTLTGFTMRASKFGEAEAASETMAYFSSLARTHRVGIVFGVIFSAENGRGKNMAVALDRRGNMLSHYQKIHPFSFSGEDKAYESGDELGFFQLKDWQCALTICYDLRFAGLFEKIAERKPDVVFIIANWAEKRIEHWETLLRARALDTQAFVVGVNRVGKGGGITYNGHSLVYAPDGTRVLDAKSKEGMHIATIDRRAVTNWRKKFPSLRDKKPEVYERLQRV